MIDYAVIETVHCRNREQAAQTLRQLTGSVRIVGTKSRQHFLPAPSAPVTLVSTAEMNRIERLEVADLTCSVEPGVRRVDLDAALAERGVCLPCRSDQGADGTVGGLFAAGMTLAAGSGHFAPRALLLGIEGVLAEGLTFKAGSRVVKSVAGFDLPKLFVGSRGALFMATLLHLKLRPRPKHSTRFRLCGLTREAALEIFHRLRLSPTPPTELWLDRQVGQFSLFGTCTGNPDVVDATLRNHGLTVDDQVVAAHSHARGDTEQLHGLMQPGLAGKLIDQLGTADFELSSCGEFIIIDSTTAMTERLQALPALPAAAVVTRAAPQRRGLGTPLDGRGQQVARALKQALDPLHKLV